MNEELKKLMSEYKNKFGIYVRFPAVGTPSKEERIEQIKYCLENNVTLGHFYKPEYNNDKIF